MNRNEFWLGACVFLMLIGAGYVRPFLKQLETIVWIRPMARVIRNDFRDTNTSNDAGAIPAGAFNEKEGK